MRWDLKYILLTHAHYDHVFGTNRLRSISGAKVCAGRDDCEILRQMDLPILFSVFPDFDYFGGPIEVDQELEDGDVIKLGDVKIEVLATPGHTPGSVCYLMHKDGQSILFSGDVIASLNFGPATYPVHISPRYRGDAESYLKTINRLLEMEPPDLLMTAHPRQMIRRYSARVDKTRWKQLLEPAKAEVELAIERQQRDGADFLDDETKEIEPGLWLLGLLDGYGGLLHRS